MAKQKKVSRKVLLGAVRESMRAIPTRSVKNVELVRVLSDILDIYDPRNDGEEAFANYRARLSDETLAAMDKKPSKKKKGKGKKAVGPTYRRK